MVSMKMIARRCKVSVATVSKALSDRGDIGEDTKNRIRQTAKELGYVPNVAARALKTKHSYNIGVLFEEQAGSGLTHEYFSGVLNGLKLQIENSSITILRLLIHHLRTAGCPISDMQDIGILTGLRLSAVMIMKRLRFRNC